MHCRFTNIFLMKKLLLVLSGIIAIATIMAFSSGGGDETQSTSGAPGAYAGDPASGSANCRTCHTGAPLGNLTGVITSTIPPSGYIAGSTYTITANFVRAGHLKFGFEISPQNSSGVLQGTMANINTQTQLINAGTYITHTSTGVSGSGSKTWNFQWTAPATGQGPVTFYGMFNATNNNLNALGDSVFESTTGVKENTTAVQNIEENNFSVSIFPNPAIDFLNLRINLDELSSVQMDLLDIRGNRIENLFSEEQMNGEVSKSFDVSPYPKGIYFLRLRTEGNYSLHKVIKM